MIEKVNPDHPDKVADRIAGAIVDLGYKMQENPKIAVEVLIGHGNCKIIIESSVIFNETDIFDIVYRIAETNNVKIEIIMAKQDEHLAKNQENEIRCGDNGIFRGMPLTEEQQQISYLAHQIYNKYKSDGKYILDMPNNKVIICQSNAKTEDLKSIYPTAVINPLGDWTGGINVDTGATNRKIGSDMADSVTGGGLHGKDLSKADVSVNIYAFLKAQETGKEVKLCCAIGDTEIDGKPYKEIVEIAKEYINKLGGFEKFAEWGLF
ncbi:MAG: S-adenosylmethionine synthetase N-terminal domain-containing protein [Clostridia bacterium]|nr:S-adenosylmethionine synthetase N-terminal domain-containing protein [Clostridia bacterium]